MTTVEVPFGDNAQETAILLLAAAEKVAEDQSVVLTTSDQTFVVPVEVATEAGFEVAESNDDETVEEDKPKAPAKKTPAKK